MIKLLPLLAVFAMMTAVGCYADDTEATTNSEPATSSESEMTTATDTEMAVCDGCGAEVSSDMLAEHDGKNLCKDCIAMHDDAEEVACAGCGTMMTASTATMKDGEPFCEECAAG